MPDHNILTGTALHEPKDVATAAANKVYVTDGGGSGSFKLNSPAAQHHARTIIVNNAVVTPITLAGDSTLHTPADFVSVSSLYTPAVSPGNIGITVSNGTFTATVDGIYQGVGWMSIKSNTNSALIGIAPMLNGTAVVTGEPITKSLAKTMGDTSTVTGFGFFPLTAGDTLSLSVASNITNDLTVIESDFVLQLVQEGL